MTAHGRPPVPNALKYALLISNGYGLLAALYILFSSEFAAAWAGSMEELHRLETFKGLVFIALTSTILFVVVYALVHRLDSVAQQLLRSQEAILSAERRALAGVLASSVAHDFNNLLTVVSGELAEIEATIEDPRLPTLVEPLKQAVERGAGLAQRLSRAGRETASGRLTEGDLVKTVKAAARMLASHRALRGVAFTVASPEHMMARYDETLLHQAITNLLINAGQAAGTGGKVEVRLSHAEKQVTLEVHDTGPGVPDHLQAQIFEPFFTTKSDGTGLGLLSVRACAELQGGSVSVSRSDLGGACFRFTLPKCGTTQDFGQS